MAEKIIDVISYEGDTWSLHSTTRKAQNGSPLPKSKRHLVRIYHHSLHQKAGSKEPAFPFGRVWDLNCFPSKNGSPFLKYSQNARSA